MGISRIEIEISKNALFVCRGAGDQEILLKRSLAFRSMKILVIRDF
jgi:hypothetical protein